jgi:hypothetical protein
MILSLNYHLNFYLISQIYGHLSTFSVPKGAEMVLRCWNGAEVLKKGWGAGGSKSALSHLIIDKRLLYNPSEFRSLVRTP